jgi:hemerythrin superfamily protein
MYDYYSDYLKAKGDPDAQARWARQLTWEIARHAAGEEIVVYPLMEKHLGPQGLKLADRDRAEHQVWRHSSRSRRRSLNDDHCSGSQKVKEMLHRLEDLTAGTTEYNLIIGKMMRELKEHNDSERKKIYHYSNHCWAQKPASRPLRHSAPQRNLFRPGKRLDREYCDARD